MQLKLADIKLDGGTQSRATLNPDWIAKYAQDLHSGIKFDPIEVVFDGTNYWCWDGFHRCAASRQAKFDTIEANVMQGTQEDAQWQSLSANKKHGLPRNNRDKIRAVQTAFAHPMGKDCSNCQIAEHCGVSEFLVRKCRKEKEIGPSSIKSKMRTVTRGGKSYKQQTANIGQSNPHSKSSKRKKQMKISRNANVPKIGLSKALRMIPLQFCPDNPHTAAATLIQHFSREFLETIVRELSEHLAKEGA